MNRRDFLKLLLATSGGLLASCRQPALLATPPPVSPTPPATRSLLPAPPLLAAGRITPIDELYRQTYSPPPPILDLAEWSLTVEGQARTPLKLTWGELQTFTAFEQTRTLECLGNPVGGRLIGNLVWRGVSLREVLSKVEPAPEATHLVMSSADEYFTAVPLELALDERSMLAFEANGEPLPRAHGFPVRALLPGVYGQKQPKWITSLWLSDKYLRGTWEKAGWSDTANVCVNSRIDFPPAKSALAARQAVPVSGIAFADL